MSLKKIKIQIPSIKRLFFNSVVGIIIGTLCTYPQGVEIFVGTLCTSFILLINVISWIIVVGKIIATVRQNTILYNEEFQSQVRNDVIAEASEKEANSEDIDKSFSEDQLGHEDDHSDQEVHSYKPNTGGATLFFMLKIPLLFLLLMLCAVVFSPLCIIFSNTIIVLSLLSSTIRVIWKAQKV